MKAPSLPKILLIALSAVILLVLPSCVDPGYGYYGGSGYYGSSSYSALPYGYNTIHVSGIPYYYYGNSWYRRGSGRYIRCGRPHGYHGTIGRHSSYGRGINHLPRGYRSHNIGGSRYYSHGNTWYRRKGSNYHVTPRPKNAPRKHHATSTHRSASTYRHSPSIRPGSSHHSNSTIRSSSTHRSGPTYKASSTPRRSVRHSKATHQPNRSNTGRSISTPRKSTPRTSTPRASKSKSKRQKTPRTKKKSHTIF
jgi:hypothetical protein